MAVRRQKAARDLERIGSSGDLEKLLTTNDMSLVIDTIHRKAASDPAYQRYKKEIEKRGGVVASPVEFYEANIDRFWQPIIENPREKAVQSGLRRSGAGEDIINRILRG